jgi:hypothetical protein
MPPEDASLRQRPVKALGSEAENLGGIPWTEEYRVTIETEISNIEALVLLFKVSNCFVPHLSWSRGWSTYKGRRSWLRDRGGQEYGIPNEPQTTTVKAILLQFVKHEQDFRDALVLINVRVEQRSGRSARLRRSGITPCWWRRTKDRRGSGEVSWKGYGQRDN